jgi:hypothetical protein
LTVGVGVGVGQAPLKKYVSHKSGQSEVHGLLPNKIHGPSNDVDKHQDVPVVE